MDNGKYIVPFRVSKQFNVTSGTLRRWSEEGKIRCIRPNNGRRLYNLEDIEKFFGVEKEIIEKKTICYARVSSSHQKEDLDRQVDFLQSQFPDSIVFKDIGSGLNWKRNGFNALLELIYKGDVGKVVVTYRDRLCRFGIELVEWIFKKHNVKLLVLSSDPDQKDPSKELSEDLLAITTVFVARNNGLRAGNYKRERKERESKKQEGGI
jgi:putative resolvase